MTRAIGISVHTGWGAVVVVDGTARKPVVVANEIIHVLGDDERFCFHMAAEMKRSDVDAFLARVQKKARDNAKAALAALAHRVGDVGGAAVVAKDGDAGDLDHILAAHPRLHTAEGALYRDAFLDACQALGVVTALCVPRYLDHADPRVQKLAAAPWGKDQRLATMAALTVQRRATAPASATKKKTRARSTPRARPQRARARAK
jgi:hypothetical protein